MSTWNDVNAGVSQGAILGPLLFLIYVNDLSENLSSNSNYFQKTHLCFGSSMISILCDGELNEHLKKVNFGVFKGKQFLMLVDKLKKLYLVGK